MFLRLFKMFAVLNFHIGITVISATFFHRTTLSLKSMLVPTKRIILVINGLFMLFIKCLAKPQEIQNIKTNKQKLNISTGTKTLHYLSVFKNKDYVKNTIHLNLLMPNIPNYWLTIFKIFLW